MVIIMIIKNAKMTSKTIKLTIIATMFVIIGTTMTFENAYAATCSWPNTDHCYATGTRTSNNDGNKATLVAANISTPSCSSTTPHLTAVPLWIGFPNTDWVEVGYATGRINGVCDGNDVIYTYKSVAGVKAWTTHGTITPGSTYTFSIDDSTSNTTWKIKQGFTQLNSIATTHASGAGKLGSEVTSGSATVSKVHDDNISYYSGGWVPWSTGVSMFKSTQTDNPLNYLVCSTYSHLHFGTNTLTPCTGE